MTHKINFEVASERATIKEHMLLPPNDGQWKHPEHLNEHEMLQILQRESLNQNWPVVKKMLLEFPEGKRKARQVGISDTSRDEFPEARRRF